MDYRNWSAVAEAARKSPPSDRGGEVPRLLALLFAVVLAAAAGAFTRFAVAEPASPEDALGGQTVIERQLEAFSRDAWAEAFDFAGPGVRSVFQTPENFGAMVRGGYPMVWRPGSVEFLGAEMSGGDLMQTLLVVDAQGEAFHLLYRMRRIDGAWRVEGVWVKRAPPPATA